MQQHICFYDFSLQTCIPSYQLMKSFVQCDENTSLKRGLNKEEKRCFN